jgi:hypothetical protein
VLRLRCRRMSLDSSWSQAIDGLRRRTRRSGNLGLLDDAARYRTEAARCNALARQAIDIDTQSQLTAIAETYRRLARQLESLARLS